MTKTMTRTNTDVSFEKQFNGYDRVQVDQYIARLTRAYQEAYDEYNSLCGKNDELTNEINELRARVQREPNADVITKALVNTEILTQKLIGDANAEAEKMLADAQARSKKLIDDGYIEKAAAKLQSEQTLEEASAEAGRIVSAARQDLIRIQNEKAMLVDEITQIVSKMKTLGYANAPLPPASTLSSKIA